MARNSVRVFLKALDRTTFAVFLSGAFCIWGLDWSQRVTTREINEAMTANVSTDDRAACVEAGMDDFLGKPMRIEDVVEVLLRIRTE